MNNNPNDHIDHYDDMSHIDNMLDNRIRNDPPDMLEDSIQGTGILPPDQCMDILENHIEASIIDPPLIEYKPEAMNPIIPEPRIDYMRSPIDNPPPGLLDRPDRRDAPYNPFKYTPSGKSFDEPKPYRKNLLNRTNLKHSNGRVLKKEKPTRPCPIIRDFIGTNFCGKLEGCEFLKRMDVPKESRETLGQ